MGKVDKKVQTKQKSVTWTLPFTKTNYQILAAGIICIVLGYIALAQEPWNGTMPLVVAPILLVLGYCVLIPFGILYKKRSQEITTTTKPEEPVQPQN